MDIYYPKKLSDQISALKMNPCFKWGMINGIWGGFALALGSFLVTKNVSRATDFALFGFGTISLGYGVHCNYNRRKQLEQYFTLTEMMVQADKKKAAAKLINDAASN